MATMSILATQTDGSLCFFLLHFSWVNWNPSSMYICTYIRTKENISKVLKHGLFRKWINEFRKLEFDWVKQKQGANTHFLCKKSVQVLKHVDRMWGESKGEEVRNKRKGSSITCFKWFTSQTCLLNEVGNDPRLSSHIEGGKVVMVE